MKDKVIRLRVDDDFTQLVDKLTVEGNYSSHSECIREIITGNSRTPAPTVDTVEVIRCKDCKFFLAQNKNGNGNGHCEYGYFGHASNSNDFCSSAER